MTEAIRTEHLKFSYDAQSESGGVMVFDDLNLSIEEGSFVAVLGHNGCGKSTLAKHFNAVLLPEGGSVQVFGMDTSDESLLVDIRRTVGMVFQNPDNQMVANVVEEDVAFAPENLGVPSEEIRRRVDEALKLVGMYDYRLHAPHLLSGGQKQRVAIAGVIAMRPRCIVLDEPTAMLDRGAHHPSYDRSDPRPARDRYGRGAHSRGRNTEGGLPAGRTAGIRRPDRTGDDEGALCAESGGL